MIVREVCTRTGLLLARTVSAFPGNIMLQNIAVIPWLNFTTFDVVSLKACSTLKSSMVVSDNYNTTIQYNNLYLSTDNSSAINNRNI